MTFNDVPIRKKLTLTLMLTSGILVILTCLLFFFYELFTFRQRLLVQVSTLSKIIADNCTASLAFVNPDDAAEVLSALKAQPQIVSAALHDGEGKLFATYPMDLKAPQLPRLPATNGHLFELTHLIVQTPVVEGSSRLGTLYIKSNLASIYTRFKTYGAIVGLVMVVTFIAGYTLSRFMQNQISRPILALAETARAVAQQQDFSGRAVKFGNDEIGLFTDTFNKMLDEINERTSALRESEERVRKLNQELERRVIDRTAQLEAANKELEAFSYSVSHDLRAPLRHISGFADMLHRQASEILDPKGLRYLTLISEAAVRMGMLIDDMLDFSRIGRTELRRTKVRPEPMIREVISMIQGESRERNIEWKCERLPTLEADASMLRQVFVNLLSNAVKYTRPRDPAQIEIGTMNANAGEAVIFVRDNGVGFDMQYANRLFGVFQRLHRSEEFDGTGIGLANVARIIHRHGGRVWAEGIPDRGATFYFSLPNYNTEDTNP